MSEQFFGAAFENGGILEACLLLVVLVQVAGKAVVQGLVVFADHPAALLLLQDVLGTIEVVLPRRVDDIGETDLEIHVPKGSSLDIETVSAWIRIEGVHGNLMAESVSGSITCEGTAESVEFETVSGGIEITGVKSRIEAESVSGAVEIRDAGGAVEAATVSGSVTISGGDFERGDFESVSGALHFEGDLESDGHYQFENLSGSTTLVLPEEADATFTIETFSGSIKTDFGARIDSEDHGPGKFSEFSSGSGAATLEITSFSGSITLKKK